MEGLFNARDMGGLPAARGRVIAAGRLYRAEVLTHLGARDIHSTWDAADSAALASLGVRTVVDLRGVEEAESTPSAWAEATGAERALAFPIHDGGHGAARDFVDMLMTRRLDRFSPEHLGGHYVAILEDRAETFGDAFVAVADGAPALIHCTEGKDRTGLLVALILGALGTPRDLIIDDYALTSQWRPDRALSYAPFFEAAGVPLESFRTLYESPAVAMAIALDHLRQEYGTIPEYLTGRAGVAPAAIGRLQDALLEPVTDRDHSRREGTAP